MTASRLSLEGLPMDIAVALTRYGLAMNDCGGVELDDDNGFRRTGAAASHTRAELVAVIKRALTQVAPTLPYAQTITLGTSIETSEADARAPSALWLPLGDDFPEPHLHVHDVAHALVEHAQPKTCSCFDGMCRCEVVAGRTSSGLHCKAQLQDGLLPIGAMGQPR